MRVVGKLPRLVIVVLGKRQGCFGLAIIAQRTPNPENALETAASDTLVGDRTCSFRIQPEINQRKVASDFAHGVEPPADIGAAHLARSRHHTLRFVRASTRSARCPALSRLLGPEVPHWCT